ncbi:MAG: conjugal transfer protein TraN [Duodenibacillus sp.]
MRRRFFLFAALCAPLVCEAAQIEVAATDAEVAAVEAAVAADPSSAVTVRAADGSEMTCIVTSSVCTQGAETRKVNGISVTRDCWARKDVMACIKPIAETDAANGCAAFTLNDALTSDAQTAGCRKTADECTDPVTDLEGNTTCAQSRESWSCASQFTLPAVNAQWTGEVDEVQESVDDSACTSLIQDAACERGKVTCSGGNCTLSFACAGFDSRGCSKLAAIGCTVGTPACDASVDSSCVLKTATATCEGVCYDKEKLPDSTCTLLPVGGEDIVASGEAVVTDSVYTRLGMAEYLTKDTAACDALTQAPGMQCTQNGTDVNGKLSIITVNKKNYIGYWGGWDRTYDCVNTTPRGSCTGLQATSGCTVESQTCLETSTVDGATVCNKSSYVYACGAADAVSGGEATLIESSSSITDTVLVSTCTDYKEDASCSVKEMVCTIPGGTKIVNGKEVTKDCWGYDVTYTCGESGGEADTEIRDTCAALEADATCKAQSNTCFETDEEGNCTMLTKSFVCGGGTETMETGEVCDNTLCIAGVCEKTPDETSTDFLEGIAVMEIARQAGVYGDATTDTLFNGFASSCTIGHGVVLANCCDCEKTGAGLSNSGFQQAVIVGAQAAVELITHVASPYVYDLIATVDPTGIIAALYDSTGKSYTSDMSVSYYGLAISYGEAGMNVSFDPQAFLIQMAVSWWMKQNTCTAEDAMHNLRQERGLCHWVGTYCDKKEVNGSCRKYRDSWVCFNSRLARIVVEEGRKQLGIGWGTPQEPITRGFTLEEFQKLDFSRMDLSGIVSEIAQQAMKEGLTVDTQAAKDRALERLTELQKPGSNQYTQVNNITGTECTGELCARPAASSYVLREGGVP